MYRFQQFVTVAPYFTQGNFKQYSLTELMVEPSLYSCSPLYVDKVGGPITKEIITQIRELFKNQLAIAEAAGLSANVDVRIHRLMPGMYPGIPGWHCDFVPRGKYAGQPDFTKVERGVFHIALILSNEPKGVSNTEYVHSSLKLKLWDEEHVYRDMHKQVERIEPDTVTAKDGQFVWFNQKTIHRAKPAVRRGVRLFLRFSMLDRPQLANQVVEQQQIYLLSEENGW